MTETGALPRASRLEHVLAQSSGGVIERAYIFEPLERRGTSFSLLFVTLAGAEDRLEMVALGGRIPADGEPEWDFVRRARFPRSTLPAVLEEFIDRCGAEGASYRELDLSAEGPDGALPRLRQALSTPNPSEAAPGTVDPA